jgi:hypothetical protein
MASRKEPGMLTGSAAMTTRRRLLVFGLLAVLAMGIAGLSWWRWAEEREIAREKLREKLRQELRPYRG